MNTRDESLEEWENRVRGSTLATERDATECIERLLDTFLKGFGTISHLTITEDGQPREARLMLLTKTFNSMECARDLLLKGYYTQAITLIRTAWEDWLVCMDSMGHPETAVAVLGRGGRVPSFKKMAARLDEEAFRSDWSEAGGEGSYGVLSTYGHPRARALNALYNPETKMLRLGPDYDERLFLFTAHYLLNAGIRMAFFLAEAATDDWVKNTLVSSVNEASKCRDVLIKRAEAILHKDPT